MTRGRYSHAEVADLLRDAGEPIAGQKRDELEELATLEPDGDRGFVLVDVPMLDAGEPSADDDGREECRQLVFLDASALRGAR